MCNSFMLRRPFLRQNLMLMQQNNRKIRKIDQERNGTPFREEPRKRLWWLLQSTALLEFRNFVNLLCAALQNRFSSFIRPRATSHISLILVLRLILHECTCISKQFTDRCAVLFRASVCVSFNALSRFGMTHQLHNIITKVIVSCTRECVLC